MLTRTLPEVGLWYENRETGSIFEVIAIDDQGMVATQYFDGEIEEIETEIFLKTFLHTIDQPEDWSGPFEIGSEDRHESDFFALAEEAEQEPNLEPEYMRVIE